MRDITHCAPIFKNIFTCTTENTKSTKLFKIFLFLVFFVVSKNNRYNHRIMELRVAVGRI